MTKCSRTGAEAQTRFTAVLGLLIACAVLTLVSFGLAIGSKAAGATSPLRPISLLTMVLSAMLSAIAMALFVYTIDNWYFCDRTFCELEFPGDATCRNEYSYSFLLVGLGVFFMIVAFIAQSCFLRASADDEFGDEECGDVQGSPAKGDTYRATDKKENKKAAKKDTKKTNPVQKKDSMPPAPPPGDWEYVAESGLYWSDAEYLYLDTNTNQYFDPDSNQWYDPATGDWYTK
jgi:hypothetical protein